MERMNAQRGTSESRKTWLCGVCGREISWSHMKRHLAAHDRQGADRERTNAEWLTFLRVTGWPR